MPGHELGPRQYVVWACPRLLFLLLWNSVTQSEYLPVAMGASAGAQESVLCTWSVAVLSSLLPNPVLMQVAPALHTCYFGNWQEHQHPFLLQKLPNENCWMPSVRDLSRNCNGDNQISSFSEKHLINSLCFVINIDFSFGHTGSNESGKPPRLACLGTKALILGDPGTSRHSVVRPDTPFDAAYIDTKRTHGRPVE
ncbi:uncharacterized protein B0T23DRAFT_95633 [Neurospora hispaniola]|uniref:Uncharacterized protein n=1 Tax=Neurospora hispaniola TaxID=588809 RepID=A0AAJ0MUA2_9PEZI|nr:hypothetical protein B0T23DRAFT_95633 [Neurospora hispaniola]